MNFATIKQLLSYNHIVRQSEPILHLELNGFHFRRKATVLCAHPSTDKTIVSFKPSIIVRKEHES